MRFLVIFPLLALLAHAQPLSQSDPVFSQNNSPLLQGCVGAWRLEEASGTRYDLSPKGNHMTANNSPSGVVGKVGNGVGIVPTASQWLNCPSNTSLQTGDVDFTVACWFLITNKTSIRFIFSKDSNANGREWDLYYSSTTDRITFIVFKPGPTQVTLVSTNLGSPSLLTWYCAVAWHDSAADTISLQINNATPDVQITGGALQAAGTTDVRIGSSLDTTTWFSGIIDEVYYWKRLLTAAERGYLYNLGLGTHTPWAHP